VASWVVMAIEAGKFQNLLFDDFDRLDHAALRAVARIVVGLPRKESAAVAAGAVALLPGPRGRLKRKCRIPWAFRNDQEERWRSTSSAAAKRGASSGS